MVFGMVARSTIAIVREVDSHVRSGSVMARERAVRTVQQMARLLNRGW